jgi:hypothetical protein
VDQQPQSDQRPAAIHPHGIFAPLAMTALLP